MVLYFFMIIIISHYYHIGLTQRKPDIHACYHFKAYVMLYKIEFSSNRTRSSLYHCLVTYIIIISLNLVKMPDHLLTCMYSCPILCRPS